MHCANFPRHLGRLIIRCLIAHPDGADTIELAHWAYGEALPRYGGMNKFIAAALFVAAQWQPAHAQVILGSIPEEFEASGAGRRTPTASRSSGPAPASPRRVP